MAADNDDILKRFVKLALALDQHIPGFVDSYYGPSDLLDSSKERGKIPLGELEESTLRLAQSISKSDYLDSNRREFLTNEVRSIQTSLQIQPHYNRSCKRSWCVAQDTFRISK